MGGACCISKFCDFFLSLIFFVCVAFVCGRVFVRGILYLAVRTVESHYFVWVTFYDFFPSSRASVRRCVWMGDAVSSSAHSGIALVRVGDADVSSLDEHWQIC